MKIYRTPHGAVPEDEAVRFNIDVDPENIINVYLTFSFNDGAEQKICMEKAESGFFTELKVSRGLYFY